MPGIAESPPFNDCDGNQLFCYSEDGWNGLCLFGLCQVALHCSRQAVSHISHQNPKIVATLVL